MECGSRSISRLLFSGLVAQFWIVSPLDCHDSVHRIAELNAARHFYGE